MAEGTKVGGAYIEITADSAPAEKAVATFSTGSQELARPLLIWQVKSVTRLRLQKI